MHTHLLARLRRHTAFGLLLAVLASAANLAAAFSISTVSSPGTVRPLQYDPGSSVRLTLAPYGSPAPIGTYQWLHDEQPIPGATTDSLTLTALAGPDSGNYRLRITSGGIATYSDNTVTLNVLVAPPTPVDPTFTAEVPATLKPTTIFPGAADGSLVIQCIPSTASYDDGTARTAIRLNADGRREASLMLTLGGNRLLTVLPNGELLTALPPYRLLPDGSPEPLPAPAGFDFSKPLDTVTAQADGKFLIAQGPHLVRLNADGTLDPSFSTDLSVDRFERLQLDSFGRIVVQASLKQPQNWASDGIVDRLTSTGQRDPKYSRLEAERYWYYPTPLPGGGIFLEFYWSNYEGPILERLNDDGTFVPGWSAPSYDESYANMVVDQNRPGTVWTRDLRRFLLTDTGLTYDPTFSAGIVGTLDLVLPDGKLLVTRSLNQLDGTTTTQLLRLRTTDLATTFPPVASIGPGDATPPKGSTLTLTGNVGGTGPFSYQWLALDGQPLPTNTTSARLTIPSFSLANLGRYQLRVTGAGGVSVLSNVTRVYLSGQPSYLSNLSGRATSGTGEDTIIAGVTTQVTAGALGLSTLIRGAGPALKPLGVANFLPNPALDLYNSAGQLIANNDQWSVNPDVAAAATAAGAFSFATGSNDAALLSSFGTGHATVMLKSQDSGSGIGLLEIYQLFPTGYEYGYQSLLNLSFRARTAPGESTAIAGFVIVDPQNFDRPARVLLRAVGPTLSTQGIVHPLANPILTVYDVRGNVVAQNDDWSVSPAGNPTASADLAAAMKQVGAFALPADSKDAALLLDLPAGAYTMHATGGSGVVLLEIYLVR